MSGRKKAPAETVPDLRPEKVDPLAVGPERLGRRASASRAQEDRDAPQAQLLPPRNTCSPERQPAASGAAPASEHYSQHPRCVPERLQGRRLPVEVVSSFQDE